MFNFIKLGMGEQAGVWVYPLVLVPLLMFILLLLIVKRL
jgi:hypothetical protein